MALKIRLARAGSKKRPTYRIVVSDSRNPRDGRFIEKVGTHNPLLPKDSENRVTLKTDRVEHWLSQGARPTDRVARFLDAAGLMKRTANNNPVKAKPKAKAQERLEAAAEAAKEAEEAAKEAAAAPVEEAAPEETAEAEAPAAETEEAPAAEAEAPAEDSPAEDGAKEEPADETKA